MDKYYLVGKIVNTFGIKGEVKVLSDTSFDRFSVGSILYIKQNNNYIEIKVDSHRVHQGFDLITFNGFKNINDIEKYKGLSLYCIHDKKLEEGHYYYEDLIGLDAIVDGKVIGKVKDILEIPSSKLLEIDVDGVIKYVPFNKEFIGEVTDKFIEIIPIEGLL